MLLDTHVLLWLLNDNPRLGPATRAGLTSGATVHVSAASVWEIAIKIGLGKLAAPDDLPSRIEDAGLVWLSVSLEHAWTSRLVGGLPHRDPFDRMLLAQASVERLPFTTVDRALLGARIDPAVTLLDARS